MSRIKDTNQGVYEVAVRDSSRRKLVEAVGLIQDLSREEIANVIKDKDQPALLIYVAMTYLRAIKDGDNGALERLYDRVIGRSIPASTANKELPVIKSESVQEFCQKHDIPIRRIN